jgi:hypothetical protein
VNAGIAINAQAAKPINIERFIGVSLCAASISDGQGPIVALNMSWFTLVRRDAW